MANVRNIPRVTVTMRDEKNNSGSEGRCPSLQEMSLRQLSGMGFFTPADHMYGVIMSARYGWSALADVRTEIELLLHYVASGNYEQAEAMLQVNPELLLKEGYVRDEAGRTLYGTAFRIALAAKDVSNSQYAEMAEMLKYYFKKLKHGDKEIQKQIATQFPEGWEDKEKKRKNADMQALQQVFDRVSRAATEKESKEAVNHFRVYLDEQKTGIYSTGFHFNDDLFRNAVKQYLDHYLQFGGRDSSKNRLVVNNVIGLIESHFTACLAQAARECFSSVAGNKTTPVTRRKKLDFPRDFPFFHPELGRSHFVWKNCRLSAGEATPGQEDWRGYATALSDLCQLKNEAITNYMVQVKMKPVLYQSSTHPQEEVRLLK